MLHLLRMILLMFLEIRDTHIESGVVIIIAGAHLSQSKIIHLSGFTFSTCL